MNKQTKGIGLFGLIGIVVSCCIGSGIFALPALLAKQAAPGCTLVAWCIVGLGFLALALSLANLREKHPDIDGIFVYAKEGFGPFAGFLCGWGYCLMACLAITGLSVIFMRVLCQLYPATFGNSAAPNMLAVVLGCALIWTLALLVIRGVEGAASFNAGVMFIKVIALLVFIAFCLIHFDFGILSKDFWGMLHPKTLGEGALATQGNTSFGFPDVARQIIACLLPMTWIFGGIEGASVISARAAKKSDVGRAAIIGLGILLTLYICTSVLPYAIVPYEKLMTFPEPSTADVFKIMEPQWGGTFISVAIGISVIGTMLSLTILPTETSSMMAKHRIFPSTLSKLNKYNSPQKSILVAALFAQVFLFIALFSRDAYTFAFSLCAINFSVTWTFAIAFQIKCSIRNHDTGQLIIGIIALLFQICGPFATGWKFVLLTCLGYVPGIFVYLRACKENNLPKFSHKEALSCAMIVAMSVLAIILTATGVIPIS